MIFSIRRALWAFAETFLGFLFVDILLGEIIWGMIFFVSSAVMLMSFIKSLLFGASGEKSNGTLMIDNSGETSKWLLQIDTPLDRVEKLPSIRLTVNPNASFSEEKE